MRRHQAQEDRLFSRLDYWGGMLACLANDRRIRNMEQPVDFYPKIRRGPERVQSGDDHALVMEMLCAALGGEDLRDEQPQASVDAEASQ